MKVLLIIPAYNESENIVNTISRIEAFKKDICQSEIELAYVVINDGSTDQTDELLHLHHINHVTLVSNLGIGGAVQTGYLYAVNHGYDIAVQFDGDGQHDIASLPQLLAPIIAGQADFTIGSRFTADSPSTFQTSFMRRFGIRLISGVIQLVSGFRVYDVTSGYRAANRECLTYLAENYPKKYPEPESIVVLVKQKKRLKEVGVNMFEREHGKSSITPIKSMTYMLEVCAALLLLSLKGREK